MGNGRNPGCPPPPDWQVDAVAGDYAELMEWSAIVERRCILYPAP